MTRHNIKDHLDWLIKAGSSQPPQPAYAPPSSGLTSALDPSLAYPSSQQQFESISGDLADTWGVTKDVGIFHSRPEFARPLLPASILNAQGSDTMARLQSGTKSSNKPRLLSETIPLSLQTPTASSGRAPGTSLKDRYSAQWERRAPGSAPPAQRYVGNGRPDPPTSSLAKARQAYQDPAAVDLTGDETHASSSSTVEAFGESRPLWREDSASPKEPLLVKNKKRKSDEFEEDELHAGGLHRLSQSSFTAIDMFEDNATPQKTEPHSQRKTKRITTSQNATYYVHATDQAFDDDLNSPSTLGKASRQRGSGSPMASNVPPAELAITRRSVKRETEAEDIVTRPIGRKTIADSEDEDEEAEIHAKRWPVKQKTEKSEFPVIAPSVPMAEDRLQPSKKEDSPSETKTASKILLPQALTANHLHVGSSASPYQRDSPTKLSISQQPPHSPQILSSSDNSNRSSGLADNEAIRAFLSFQTNRIQGLLDGLHRARRSVAEAVYSRMVEGRSSLPELQRQAAVLTTRIDAMDSLLSLREEYVDLTKQKDAVKARILAAVGNDLDPSYYAKDQVDQSRILQRRAEIEKDISRLWMEASPDDLPPAGKGRIVSESAINDPQNRPTTLVQSTQAYSHAKPRATPDIRPPISSGPTTTQYVQQTQAFNIPPQTPSKQTYGQDGRRQPSPLKTYASSPAVKDVNAYFSPSKTSITKQSSPELRQRKGYETSHNKAAFNHPKLDRVQENEDIFTTHMGSPYQPERMDDEYGEDDDDVDMLEVAEELENRDSRPALPQANIRREVLAETSGNTAWHEAPELAPPHAPSAFTHMHHQPSQMQHPWSRDVKSALKDRFHLRGFRPNQLEAINATLAGKDAFVLMPTGGGKSLCYQLPSIVNSGKTQGVTVVISPLLSLMQDQVDHLQKLKIQALLVNGEVTAEHRRLVMNCLKDPQPQRFCQLLYITPEMINKSQAMIKALQGLYDRQKLARIVIDEAHCVSQWGHDFRPDYKLLGEVRQQFRGVPVIALTATATENVKVDVIHNLGIRNCEVFTQSFNRPNLNYEVRSKGKSKDVLDSMANTIKTTYRGQSGIIYCLSKKNCEDIAGKLQKEYDIPAHHYHAGMEPEEKKYVQKEWQSGRYHVIVATIAFGMGIDKPDVRFVIHHTIPKSLEGYYQETGRAGRDGKRSGCYMYYGYQDTSMIKRMIDDGEGSWDQKERQRQMLRMVIAFCENKSDCRRVQVLGYFNESFNKEDCRGSCDNCNSNSTFETQDFTEYAAAALQLVKKIQPNNVTLLHCVDVFRGAKTKKITDLHHDDLQEYGAGSDIDRGNVERLFYRLLSEDAIEEQNVVNKLGFANQYVHLGKNSYDFAKGRRKLKIQIRLSPTRKPKAKPVKKKRETGVAASHPDYPASTNVSSPVQAASRRRLKPTCKSAPPLDLHKYDYSHADDFFVDDDEEEAVEIEEDDSEESFEPLRVKGKTRSTKKRPLGPPITIDEKIARLNQIHQMVVEDFVNSAKQQSQKLLVDKGLRAHPFTDTILREMAINFPQTESEMLEIPNIDPDKVGRYGKLFLRLVKEAHRGYEAMMQQQEDCPQDPNHQNVIDISSDDEYGNGDELDEFDLDEESPGERSQYFPANDVNAFNAQLTQLPPPAPSVRAQSQSHDAKARSNGRGGRYGRGGFKKGSRKASGASKSRACTGAKKKQSENIATSSRSSGSNLGPGKSRQGGSGGGFGGRGIGMMPI